MATERELRQQLAAAYRLAALFGWEDTLYTHFSVRLPGDGEGMQTILKNARNMAWLLKLIEAGKDTVPLPENEQRIMTNFIR